MSLPGIVAATVAQRRTPAEIYAPVPVPVRRSFALFLNAAEGEEFAAGVVENAVYHYVDSGLMPEGDKFFKVFIGSQPAVYQLVIPGVIAVSGRFKKRTNVDGRASKRADMWNPLIQLLKTPGRLFLCVLFWCAGNLCCICTGLKTTKCWI